MTKTVASPPIAESGRDAAARRIPSAIGRHVSAKARWLISAAVALIAPLALVTESASMPIVEAMACFGNGTFMALAASANAFTLIP